MYLTTSKGEQYYTETPNCKPFLGWESQQIHNQWHSSNPNYRINSFASNIEAHLPKQETISV